MLPDPELFARCPLPGCARLTDVQGQPCDDCRRVFGEMIAHTPGGVPLTARAQAARDAETLAAYGGHAAIAAAEQGIDDADDGVTRSNQLCWLCDQRRRCTRIDGRWECRDCAIVT